MCNPRGPYWVDYYITIILYYYIIYKDSLIYNSSPITVPILGKYLWIYIMKDCISVLVKRQPVCLLKDIFWPTSHYLSLGFSNSCLWAKITLHKCRITTLTHSGYLTDSRVLHLFYNCTAKLFKNETYIHSIQDATPNIDTYHSAQNVRLFLQLLLDFLTSIFLIGNLQPLV